jgi:signal transduction histidine kinase/tetratricopeptide (TPR) repeat protein
MVTTATSEFPRPRHPGDLLGPVPSRVANRFAVSRVLRRGASTATLAATDEQTGDDVVLKTARSAALARGTRLRLMHEADVLRSLDGPGLVPLVAAGEADGLFYLVMPMVAGRTLAERLAEGRLDVTETLRLAQDLLSALAAVHERGILHRDLKPSNIMVGDGAVRGATLIDFGLARTAQLDESVRDEPVGTARYTSPEQAGLLPREVDERSDLYSVGVVLFECMTGRPPFIGETVGEVLRQHLAAPPPDVRSYGIRVPAIAAQIVQRLLRKEPRDRYQSATGALADVRRLAERLLAGDTDPAFALGTADVRSSLTEPAFVGRRGELAALLSAAREAAAGHGGILLVEAESGGGKSRLLEELAQRALDADTLILRGQGVDQAARGPFQLLEGVAADLGSAVHRDPALADRIRERLADDRGALLGAVPRLAEAFGVDSDEADAQALLGTEMLGPEEFGEARALSALGRLLDVLGSSQRLAVVLLDDCQWADEPTVRLLARWQREVAGTQAHVLVVAAYRAEEVRHSDPLRSLTSRRVELAPFGPYDVQGLVESMAGTVPKAALDLVRRLSAGSPFMASAVVRGLAESGALFHDGHSWRVDDELMDSVQSSREAATFLTRRLDLLDDDVLRLLAAGAVLGKEFDLELAAALAGTEAMTVWQAWQGLRSRHLVWLDADGLRATFVHDKVREALLDRLAADDRSRLHRLAAVRLARDGTASSYDLAYHFHAAGDDRAALPHALAAAAEARARHALAAAEQQYRIAVWGVAEDDTRTRREIQLGLGDVLMLLGRYVDAAQCFVAARTLAGTRLQRGEIGLRLGELMFKRGDVQESVDDLRDALRSLGRYVPTARAVVAMCALWEVLVQAAHCLLPQRWIQRRSLDATGAHADLVAARIYSRLAYSYWFSKGALHCGWAHLREMNLLERYPPTLELAQAYSEHAPVASTLPWYSRGRAYAQRSLDIRREFGDVWGQGQSLGFYGVVLYAGSRFEEALEKLNEAIRLLDRTGDQWEINTALWHVGFSHYRLGRPDDAVAAFHRCLANAIDIGDYQNAAIALSGISKSTHGQVDATQVADLLARCAGDLHRTGELATGEAVRLLATGQPQDAARLLTDARRRIRHAGVRNEYVAPVLPWLLTALREQVEACTPYQPSRRRGLLRRAWLVGWRCRSVAVFFRNNLPHVLREQALVAQLAGRPRVARHLARRGRRVADRLGMAADAVALRRVVEQLEAGEADVGGVPSPDPVPLPAVGADTPATLSLVDRFDTLLRLGRQITTTLTPEAVYDVVRTAAVELLRSETCTMLLLEGDGDELRTHALDSSSGLGLGERLVHEVLRTRSTAVYSSATDGEPDELGDRSARSALAAPIFVRGRPVAVWHVVHRQVSDLFGPDELRLAEFISALAGAALENAEGFAEVQGLSVSLERRVEQRTAELSVANTALRSTLAELERVNSELRRLDELKSDFVAMVSHELRSPLTSILGYCATMMRHWDRVDDVRKRSFIEIIESQSRRLSGLVNDLLEMSRIESGHLNTQLRPMPVRSFVEEFAHDYRERLPGLIVDGELDVAVVADPDHLQRVLINLVDNAIKYGAEPVCIAVTTTAGAVRIAVRDSGEGIPEDFRPRLFEKFAQASAGSKRRATGTGLGLSIVRGLVDAMAGEIWYEPPAATGPGGFVVQLPRAS